MASIALKIDLQDLQGLIVREHIDLPCAAYLLLGVDDLASARLWLKNLIPEIANGYETSADLRLQVAFSHEGLQRFGSDDFVSRGLAVEFTQGMATPFRARDLGDVEESAPENWRWGGPSNPEVHILLCLFAKDQERLEERIAKFDDSFETGGLELLHRLDTQGNPYDKEHFGFKDGIAQPVVSELGQQGPPENTVALGEFVLGYKNAYDTFPDSPVVDRKKDPLNLLPFSDAEKGMKDFGRNGTYLVFRQLYQDVPSFWRQIREALHREKEKPKTEDYKLLAAKMVGRWPNGNPLVLEPKREGKELPDVLINRFMFADADPHGFKCPFGSHIRRANPRDALGDNPKEPSLRISNGHRIIRRGRFFGPPLAPSFTVEDLVAAEDDHAERGLQFLCLNANIARQFEFLQHTWLNNTKFPKLFQDPDPILGITDTRSKAPTHDFTIQAKPLRRKVRGLARNVHVYGGAYFFLPSFRALHYLAQTPTRPV